MRVGILQSIVAAVRGGGPATVESAAGVPSSTSGVAAPWADSSNLQAVVWADYLEGTYEPVTRAEAMSVPAVKRSRLIITSDAARCPLVMLDQDGNPVEAPWLQGSSVGVSPQHRIVWTVDDLIFHGWSLWIVQRSEPDVSAPITEAARCPYEWWRFGEGEQAGRILVNGQEIPDHNALLIPGFHEGIVRDNPRVIRTARELEVATAHRAANPIPAMELHQTTADTLTRDERLSLVADWTAMLRENGGAVAYTPMSMEAKPHGDAGTDLLIQGRNASAVDGARIVGIAAAMVDASNVNASLTYETLTGRGSEYLDHTLPLYLGPIEARLSLDDVSPAGSRVRADTSALIRSTESPTGTPTED